MDSYQLLLLKAENAILREEVKELRDLRRRNRILRRDNIKLIRERWQRKFKEMEGNQ